MLLDILLNILLPVLLMVAAGAWVRYQFEVDLRTLTKLNIYLFTPAFIFDKVVSSRLEFSEMGGIMAVTVLLILLMGVAVLAVGRIGRQTLGPTRVTRPTLAAVAMAAMFYNSGNIGLPLAALAYPTAPHDGAAVQAFVVLTLNVMTFTVGLAIAAAADLHPADSPWRQILTKLLRLPVLYLLAAAVIAKTWAGDAGPAALPSFITTVARTLGGGLVPVALLTLGAQLAENPRRPRWRPVSIVLVLRLLVAPALMAGLLYALHRTLPGTFLDLWPWPAELLIFTAAVPTAVNTLLLTLELDGDADLAADCVFWTTVASLLTLTAWLAAVRVGFGG